MGPPTGIASEGPNSISFGLFKGYLFVYLKGENPAAAFSEGFTGAESISIVKPSESAAQGVTFPFKVSGATLSDLTFSLLID